MCMYWYILHPVYWFNLGCDCLPMCQYMLECHEHVSPTVTVQYLIW